MAKWQPGCAMKVRDNKTHTATRGEAQTHVHTLTQH